MNESSSILALNNDLMPEGWAESTLVDLVSSRKGKKPRELSESARGNSVPYIDIAAFERGEIRQYADMSSSVLVEPDDVLVVWDGARCGLAGKTPVLGALGSTLMHLKPHLIFPDYLVFLLQSRFEEINTNPRGSGITHVNPELFWELHLPIPPLAEQKRIVAKIEELLPQVNAVKERLNRTSQIMKRFRQAVLSAACSGRLTEGWRETEKQNGSLSKLLEQVRVQRKKEFEESSKVARTMGQRPPQRPLNLYPGKVEELSTVELPEIPEEWMWVAMGDVTAFAQYGSSIKADSESQGGIPMLRMGNIQDGKIVFPDLKYVRFEEELKAFILEVGDFLFNRTNSPELVGKSAIFDSHTTALFASYLIRLKFDKELANPTYVCYWMNSLHGRAWAREVRTDGVSQSNINATKLLMMPLPLPPLLEQNEIVRRIEALFKLAEAIEKRIEAAGIRADKLTQSILAKAFRGELIPTEAELARQEGRSYEPAEVLLERIKVERERGTRKVLRKSR